MPRHGWNLTAAIPLESLLSLLGSTVVLAFIAIGIPFTAAAIVGHGVNMAIEHLAATTYLVSSAARPVSRAIGGLAQHISRNNSSNRQPAMLHQRLAAGLMPLRKQPRTERTTPLPGVNFVRVQRTPALPQGNGAKPTSLI